MIMWSNIQAKRVLRRLQILPLILAASPTAAFAQSQAAIQVANPRSMIRLKVEGQASPPASLADVDWLQGHWIGEMPGGAVEHYTMSPIFGHLPAFVRAADQKGIWFYEISLIAEVRGSLAVRVKHFTSDLAGWEAQGAYVDRPLVARDATNLYFDGITYSRTGQDSYLVYFLNRSGIEERETIVVPFRRAARR
jgi:hypothetical protein